MAGSTIKMGIDVTQFKQGMQQAQQSAKTFQAQMKANEAQFKATGDREQYLTEKGKLLKKELEAQKTAAANAQKALEAMRKNGVEETSAEYQKLEQQLAGTQAAMYNTQAAMNALTTSEGKASSGAKSVEDSLASINKKVSFDAVIKGVNSITTSLEKAGNVAARVGTQIWDNITDSAAWADDVATMATRLGMDVEDYQRHQKVFDTVADMTVRDWQNAKRKVQTAVNKPTAEQMDIFRILGVGIRGNGDPRYNNYTSQQLRQWEDVFWDLGDKLREKLAQGKITQDQADIYAQALFGKNYDALLPVLGLGKEGFAAALAEQNVVSEESVNKLAELNDELIKLKSDFRDLKSEVLAGIAPALKGAAEALDGMLTSLMEYLQKPEGQALLNSLGESVSALFTDLSNIDPESVVQNFVNVFNNLKSGFEWIKDNWTLVRDGLLGIVGVWAGGKVISGALTLKQMFQAAKNLGSGRTPTAGPSTGFGNDTGVENVTNQTVTNATVTSATLSNVTAAVTSVTTTTENVTTMYVQTLITGSGLPGTGNGGGGGDSAPPIRIAPGSDGLNGYIPDVNPIFLNPGSGSDIAIGNPAQNYLGSGGGGSDINITGNNPTINLPAGDEIPVMNPNGANNPNGIPLNPDEYEVTSAATLLEIMMMKIGGAAYSFATMDPTGVTALMGQWILDNTKFGETLRQGGTVTEALSASGNFIRNDLNKVIAKNYQDLVDAQYKAVFGKDTKELAADASKALANLWGSVKEGVLDPISTKATEIANAFNEALTQPKTVTVDVVPRGGGVSSWPYSYGGGMGANYSFGLGDHLLNHWGYANGLFSVPWDGYPAILHKGERVLTAREARSYNANSNLYVEHMHMGGGMDAQALAAAMAAQNRRISAGFGS